MAAGSWTGVIGLVAAGVAFLVTVVFAASKPTRVFSPQVYAHHGWYPAHAHAHPSYAPTQPGYGYGPEMSYGPGPARP